MLASLQSQLLDSFRILITTKFGGPLQNEPDVKTLLENPVFRQYIFPNNLVAIIDHSTFGYRYFSGAGEDIFGYSADVFMEKGLAFTMTLVHREDLHIINDAMEKSAVLMQSLPQEQKMHTRFNYSMRYDTPFGRKVVFQQTLPLALNEAGLPYLMLAIVSDITTYTQNSKMIYNFVLHLPGQFPKTLLSNHNSTEASPLTDREKEIVLCLAEGMDAGVIAEKLFISEDTVRTHRKNILAKTEAKNSVHLVRMAVANGWI